jgi:hypothetical protein
MIIELRTYQLKPGTVPQFLERFGASLPHRQKFSPLGGLFYTAVGSLNRVIHFWPYESFDARLRIRAAAVAPGQWPPATREFALHQENEVLLLAPFSPGPEPRQRGGLYEICIDHYAAGAVPGVIERWHDAIATHGEPAPLAAAWYTEIGPLNKWVHIWAYRDAADWQRARAEAAGIWPPASAAGTLLKSESMLVVPAPFSPLR